MLTKRVSNVKMQPRTATRVSAPWPGLSSFSGVLFRWLLADGQSICQPAVVQRPPAHVERSGAVVQDQLVETLTLPEKARTEDTARYS